MSTQIEFFDQDIFDFSIHKAALIVVTRNIRQMIRIKLNKFNRNRLKTRLESKNSVNRLKFTFQKYCGCYLYSFDRTLKMIVH